jgi:hypothetical protein
MVRALLRACLGSRPVAMRLHRMRTPDTAEVNPYLSIEEETADVVIGFFLAV